MKTEEELSYSIEALRVKAMFYGKKAMVYVEGDDDLNFWDAYFDRGVFELESVNGSKNLKPYIDKLEQGEKSFIVACDADYSSFVGRTYTSPLIVTTYGHSIENTMYCPHNLNETIKRLSRSTSDSIMFVEGWYDKFVASAHPLLVREITNLSYNPNAPKITVFGDTCAAFCKQKPCYELDDKKISKFCKDNEAYFPEDELSKTESAIIADAREERYLIKGHFYTEAISRFLTYQSASVNSAIKAPKASHGLLYALTVHCGKCHKESCREKAFLEASVADAIISLQLS